MDTMKQFEALYEELNSKTNEIVEACKQLNAQKAFIEESWRQAAQLIEETNECIAKLDPVKNSEELKKAREDLATYQSLFREYREDSENIIKKVNEAEANEADALWNQEFMKNITDFNRLKNTLNPDSPIEHFKIINTLKDQINGKYQKLFRTSDQLILEDRLPLDYDSFLSSSYHSSSNSKEEYREYLTNFFKDREERFLTEVIQEVNLKKVVSFAQDGRFVEIPEEPIVETNNGLEEMYITSSPETVSDSSLEEFKPPVVSGPLLVENPEYIVEKSTPDVVFETTPAVDDKKEEVTDVVNTLETQKREERQKNYDIYHMCLEKELLSFAALRKEFAAKVMSGEEIDRDYYEKYNRSLKLSGLYESEIRRLDASKEKINDLSYDLFVPTRMLNSSELEEFAATGRISSSEKLDTSLEVGAISPTDNDNKKSDRRVFKFIRKASEKTKEFIRKNKKLLFVASFVALAAATLGVGNKNINKTSSKTYPQANEAYLNVDSELLAKSDIPVISINSDESLEDDGYEDSVTVDNRSKTNRFINSVNLDSLEDKKVSDHVSIGDTFTLKPNATIYTDEYVSGDGLHPLYGPEAQRTIRFIGVTAKNSKGYDYVKMCVTNEEVDDLLAKGGKIVSVYSPLEGSEGFYKIDSINVLEKDSGRSL